MSRGFGPDEAKQFYDRFGAKQDWQSFYENPAIDELITHAGFEHAHAVFELGFGTGRLAQRLLSRHLPQDASYTGVDISTTMARLARERLRTWQERATVKVLDGTRGMDFPGQSFDRFVSVYVLDLLSPENILRVLTDARRMLVPGGRICLVSLTRGTTAWCRLVTRTWEFVYRRNPRLVGGCRPVELLEYLGPELWRTEHRNVVCTYGISSEIVVASRLPY
ncbi:MAG: methyltransferase domain-containing protein [Betaproteobacteria bacterium]